MCDFIAQLVEQCTGNAEVTGSNPVEALIFFFRLLLSNCLNWKIYCDDHSSLSWLLKLHGQTLLRFFIDRARFFFNWYYYFFSWRTWRSSTSGLRGSNQGLRMNSLWPTIVSGRLCHAIYYIFKKKKKAKASLHIDWIPNLMVYIETVSQFRPSVGTIWNLKGNIV